MSERNGLRYGLLGLALIALLGVLLFIVVDRTPPAQAAEADEPPKLESISELDGKAPARRDLDIQTWDTAEGAKVLFVAAPSCRCSTCA